MKIRRQYDEEFKKMAVEMSDAKGSLNVAAEELGISPQILTRWLEKALLLKPSELVACPYPVW